MMLEYTGSVEVRDGLHRDRREWCQDTKVQDSVLMDYRLIGWKWCWVKSGQREITERQGGNSFGIQYTKK